MHLHRFKYLVSTLLVLTGSIIAYAQQRPHYSQYMANQYLVNPAVAGASQYTSFNLGARAQWVGLEDAPRTVYLTGTTFFGEHVGLTKGRIRNEHYYHHGVGGQVIVDQTGPTSRTSVYGTYAYHMTPTAGVNLGVGASVGMQQFKVDVSDLDIIDQNSSSASGVSELEPDANLGLWVYNDQFYFGAAMHQLFQNKLNLTGISDSDGENKLNSHYFVTGGYNFRASEHIWLVPSIMAKFVNPAPVSYDFNLKVRYDELAWGGISYRTNDAIVAMAGVNINDMFSLSYSFDYTTSDLTDYNNGSHEIILGVRFDPRGELWSPSDFW